MSRFKRAFDVAGACAGLLVFTPVMAIAIAAVFLEDGGPLFFRQERMGYRRRLFWILKIRSMRDGRITRVGRVLRATGSWQSRSGFQRAPYVRSSSSAS
jgi:lipopolysaccharide/colanic/teichoic acid biosynthesis glycosyltransferase